MAKRRSATATRGTAAARSAGAAASLPENAVQPGTRAAWRRWLERHHTRDRGIWFVGVKKSSGKARMTYEDMIEEALCFGWVDGQARALDAERSMLWLSPRKPRSVWSLPNKRRVERVTAAGLMRPAGQAAIDRAKVNGSWNALDTIDALEVPDDFAAALAAVPKARAHFEAFPKSAKRAMLEWIRQAKRAETRARRIHDAAAMAGDNERLGQPAIDRRRASG